jgi:hypothetical protein
MNAKIRNRAWFDIDTMYQLLGYAPLDFHDEWDISEVGVYCVRQGLLMCRSLEELVRPHDLGSLRREFGDLLMREPYEKGFMKGVASTGSKDNRRGGTVARGGKAAESC